MFLKNIFRSSHLVPSFGGGILLTENTTPRLKNLLPYLNIYRIQAGQTNDLSVHLYFKVKRMLLQTYIL